MPFGVVFAAIVFGVLLPIVGVGLLSDSAAPVRASGVLLAVFGIALAIALLRGLRWARWTGALASVLLGVLGAYFAGSRGSVLDIVLFLSAFASAILLIVPRTGDATQKGEASAAPRLAFTCGALAIALVATAFWAKPKTNLEPAPAAPTVAEDTAAPAPSKASWIDFGRGLERAKAEGRPMLVDFYADWCAPCKVMERRTFRDPTVLRGLERVVTVRVDSEEEESIHGYRGVALAHKYAIEVYPTLVLFSPEGHEVSRHTGFAEPRQLLSWLDRSLAAAPRVVAKSP